jgi:hypothetical protein
MGQCLDEMGRKYIRDLINDDRDDEYVRREIKRLLQRCDGTYQYNKNIELVDWMRSKDWPKTAQYLKNYVTSE